MKQQILSEIKEGLAALGVQAQYGSTADVTVDAELLDAKWTTGSKKILYVASVFADERERIVYMYEKTTETGSGFSFGASGESSFQSGSTLFRKVKSVQYGTDGTAFEYTFDLGAIPKVVKEAAKRNGWKFKTVLNRNRAMFPVGYTPKTVSSAQSVDPGGGFCAGCGAPLAADARFCGKCGKQAGARQ